MLLEAIKKGFEMGKTDEEIAEYIISEKAHEGENASSVAQAILNFKKAEDAKIALRKEKEKAETEKKQTEEKAAIKEEVKAIVDETLKSIQIHPFNKYVIDRDIKSFNKYTGKVEKKDLSESYLHFNSMLKLFADKDFAGAKGISNEIDQENARIATRLSGKATPSVTDVTTRGGYAIPIEVNNMIMQVFYELSRVYSRLNKDNIVMNSKVYPVMYGMSVGYIGTQSTTITEKNPTFANPSVDMKRVGGFSAISNTLIRQKGQDIVQAFINAYGSEFAQFFDLHTCVGNVTGNSDLVDGIVFDPLTSLPTPIALASLTASVLADVKNSLSAKVNYNNVVFIANRKVADKIGLLENTGGFNMAQQYFAGQTIRPFGIELIVNPLIPSTLDVGGDNRTSGTDDVLICADLSKIIVGVTGEFRIDTSDQFLFPDDALVIRALTEYGQKVVSGASTAGTVAVAQELTN